MPAPASERVSARDLLSVLNQLKSKLSHKRSGRARERIAVADRQLPAELSERDVLDVGASLQAVSQTLGWQWLMRRLKEKSSSLATESLDNPKQGVSQDFYRGMVRALQEVPVDVELMVQQAAEIRAEIDDDEKKSYSGPRLGGGEVAIDFGTEPES